MEKGALGLNDEVTSGNGFWFSLKEKDLVDKFLYGDIPQGYNPISESKSVLSKRDNPDKTTSLNTAPANKTQVLKAVNEGPATLPKQEDLEYPDITMIQTAPSMVTTSNTSQPQEEVKLPPSDDLEFPDITMVARPSTPAFQGGHDGMQTQPQAAPRPVEVKKTVVEAPADEGPVVYPKDDDLEFPDLDSMTASSTATTSEANVEEELDFKVKVPDQKAEPAPKEEVKTAPSKKSGMINFKNEIEEDSNLTLMFDTLGHDKSKAEPKHEKSEALHLVKKSAASTHSKTDHQPEKLLHERRVKSSSQQQHQQKEITKDLPKEVQDRAMPEELKKRNDNYLLYLLIIIVLIIFALFFYYYRNILNKPLPV